MKKLLVIFASCCALQIMNAVAKTPRVMSLDFCADQFVMQLADPAQIISVSAQAGLHFSFLRAKAGDFEKKRANTETIIANQPDLLVRQWGGGTDAQVRFAKRGIKVLTIAPAHNFDGVRKNIREVAAALNQRENGERLIKKMDAKLSHLSAASSTSPAALYFTPGGVTAGSNTMVHAIMQAAGLRNLAAEAGAMHWPELSLEELITEPPNLIVTGYVRDNPDEDINHWSHARHPALRHIFARVPTIHLATDSSVCGGWFGADAALDLRAQLKSKAP